MRTTTDLPPVVHQRVRQLAAERGVSISSVVADLTARGLAQVGRPVDFVFHPRSGMPVISIGRTVTSDEVADLLNDE